MLPHFVETLAPGGWRPTSISERGQAGDREFHQQSLLELQGYRVLFGVEPFDERSEEIRTAVALEAAKDPARWGYTRPPAAAAGTGVAPAATGPGGVAPAAAAAGPGGAASPSHSPSPSPSPGLCLSDWSDDDEDEGDYDGYY